MWSSRRFFSISGYTQRMGRWLNRKRGSQPNSSQRSHRHRLCWKHRRSRLNLLNLKSSVYLTLQASQKWLIYFQEGMFYANSPSTGADVISVGSVQAQSIISYSFTTSVTGTQQNYYFGTYALMPGTQPIYVVNPLPDSGDDACQALPATTPHLADYFVLIKRSTTPYVLFVWCTFSGKKKERKNVDHSDMIFMMATQKLYFGNPSTESIR